MTSEIRCRARLDGVCERRFSVKKLRGKAAQTVECDSFRCSMCRRYLPWCFGAHDSNPTRCDDCSKEAADDV